MVGEYVCEIHGRRVLDAPPECPHCEPLPSATLLRDAAAESGGVFREIIRNAVAGAIPASRKE